MQIWAPPFFLLAFTLYGRFPGTFLTTWSLPRLLDFILRSLSGGQNELGVADNGRFLAHPWSLSLRLELMTSSFFCWAASCAGIGETQIGSPPFLPYFFAPFKEAQKGRTPPVCHPNLSFLRPPACDAPTPDGILVNPPSLFFL